MRPATVVLRLGAILCILLVVRIIKELVIGGVDPVVLAAVIAVLSSAIAAIVSLGK